MKNYQEFKGYRTRVIYDPASKSFGYRKVEDDGCAPTPATAEVPAPASKPEEEPPATAEKLALPLRIKQLDAPNMRANLRCKNRIISC